MGIALNITLSQFFSKTSEYPDLSKEQKELLDIWAGIKNEDRELALAYLKGMAKK